MEEPSPSSFFMAQALPPPPSASYPMGPKPANLRPPVPGTGFHMLASAIVAQPWQVSLEDAWIKFEAHPGNEDGVFKLYGALYIPVIHHVPNSQEPSFEVYASSGSSPSARQSTKDSEETGPAVPEEGEIPQGEVAQDAEEFGPPDSDPGSPWRLGFRSGGWFPGTDRNSRHISLLNLEMVGELPVLGERLKDTLAELHERLGLMEIRFVLLREGDVSVHTEWRARTGVLGVSDESEFDRLVLRKLKTDILQIVTAHSALSGRLPREFRIPHSHITFW
jgi:hypothetical protein